MDYPNVFKLFQLASWDQLGEAFEDASARLFQNDFITGPNTLLADLDVATFTGYAHNVLDSWLAPFIDAQGRPIRKHPSVIWQPTAPVLITNVIYGWYITNTAGTELLYAERFADGPVDMALITDGIVIEPVLSLQGIDSVLPHIEL